jgi:hypothetical protein
MITVIKDIKEDEKGKSSRISARSKKKLRFRITRGRFFSYRWLSSSPHRMHFHSQLFDFPSEMILPFGLSPRRLQLWRYGWRQRFLFSWSLIRYMQITCSLWNEPHPLLLTRIRRCRRLTRTRTRVRRGRSGGWTAVLTHHNKLRFTDTCVELRNRGRARRKILD